MINGNRTKSGRKRSPRDFYITPKGLPTEAIIRFLVDERLSERERIVALDPGCGNGVWGEELKNFAYYDDGKAYLPIIHGVDLEVKIVKQLNFPFFEPAYTSWWQEDFLEFDRKGYNLIIGNPPYSLAEEFVRHSFELLKSDGYVYFLFRLSFLEGIKRKNNLFTEYPIKRVYVCSRRPSFYTTEKGKHTTDTLAYAMFLWQKGYAGKTELSYFDWNYK